MRRDDFLFTASRLEHPKRIDMIIAAMQEVSSDIPLYIAGEGDDLARLKALAEPDPRIVFLGQISEDALKQHYANALAVPFVPYDEDYGYITIEAMLSGKPVVTTLDAGGPTEFVIDGETGRVVAPEARALGQALDALVRDPAAAADGVRTPPLRSPGFPGQPSSERCWVRQRHPACRAAVDGSPPYRRGDGAFAGFQPFPSARLAAVASNGC